MKNGCQSSRIAAVVKCEQDGSAIMLENEYLSVCVCPKNGGAVRMITAKQAIEPFWAAPCKGNVACATLFDQTVSVDGKPFVLEEIEHAIKSDAPDIAEVELSAKSGSVEFERRFVILADEAAFSDEIVYRNAGDKPVKLEVVSESRIGNGQRTRWFFHNGSGYRRVLASEQAAIERPDGTFRFARLDERGLGLHVNLDVGQPFKFSNTSDAGWLWKTEQVELAPGAEFRIRCRITLLDGLPHIDTSHNSGILAWLDCPEYRDSGERIETSAFLASDRRRDVNVSVFKKAAESGEWILHAKVPVPCGAGKTVEKMLDMENANPGVMDIALVVSENDEELLRVEKRVFIGEDTPDGKSLAVEYRRKFPDGEMFEGTLRELGRFMAFRDMTAGINIEWRGLMLRTQFNLADPNVRSRAERIMAAYRKWFPNYTKALEGKAEAFGVPVEVCALAEQIMPVGIAEANDGCLDMVFRGANGNFLAWNKDRFGGPDGIVYSRYRITDGISFHMLAAYGANEAGFCTAGAALNAGPSANEKGVESVAEWRSKGGLIAPGGIFLLLLECRTVEEAVRLIENPDAPFANVGNFMLADAHDRVLVWQLNGLTRVFREPEGDWKVHTCTNYPIGWEQNESDSGNRSRWNGRFREANVARLSEGLSGELTVERIIRILRNHAEPGPLCQHFENNLPGYQTVMSYVIDPKSGDIFAAYHHPCRHKYIRYKLK